MSIQIKYCLNKETGTSCVHIFIIEYRIYVKKSGGQICTLYHDQASPSFFNLRTTLGLRSFSFVKTNMQKQTPFEFSVSLKLIEHCQ